MGGQGQPQAAWPTPEAGGLRRLARIHPLPWPPLANGRGPPQASAALVARAHLRADDAGSCLVRGKGGIEVGSGDGLGGQARKPRRQGKERRTSLDDGDDDDAASIHRLRATDHARPSSCQPERPRDRGCRGALMAGKGRRAIKTNKSCPRKVLRRACVGACCGHQLLEPKPQTRRRRARRRPADRLQIPQP